MISNRLGLSAESQLADERPTLASVRNSEAGFQDAQHGDFSLMRFSRSWRAYRELIVRHAHNLLFCSHLQWQMSATAVIRPSEWLP